MKGEQPRSPSGYRKTGISRGMILILPLVGGALGFLIVRIFQKLSGF